MLLKISCKIGSIQLTEEGTLQVVPTLSKPVWQVSRTSVTGLVAQQGSMGTFNVFMQSSQGSYTAEMVSKGNFEKLCAAFPQIQARTVGPGWYESPSALTHVVTYTKEKDLQRDMEAAFQHGWMIQGQSGQAGHVNVGRTAAKLVLTGGIGLITGVSRSKDKTTIVFVRTPEWLEKHRPS